ncbi:DUF2460 domain-containing protein [Roseobacter weihaiensis]|uniref:DUF2460 domain-containing protein n=1 Tax=Roseobacter weihaiensis TaxID=2763262 RepID=UPI001D0A2FB6|nr:DUF2460 domain-containing protein [Roseobacter sp. H9]
MAHLDRDFPRNVAQGCQAVAQRRDEIVTLASGREEINQRWQHARRSWLAGLAIRSADDMSDVLDLWEESQGRRHSFRFQDWLDYKSCRPSETPGPLDQVVGIGNGSQTDFQVSKTYGVGLPYVRPIYLPRAASLLVAVNGVEVLSGWTLSATGGVITFDVPPDPALTVTAGFLFDVPVRFEADSILAEWTYFRPGGDGVASAPDVSVIEVFLDG